MPFCWAQSPDGMLYAFNGIDPVMRWDGFTTQLEKAGMNAPTDAMTLTGTGVGDIIGDLYGYVRFMDDSGRVSSLSPISTVFTPSSSSFTVTDATFASPIVITTSASHGLNTGQIVFISGVVGNTAANGTFTVNVLTPTTFELDNSTANAAYISGGTMTTGVSKITYGNVPRPSDPKVAKRQILRNKVGDLTTFYVDIETSDLSSSTFSSTNTDDQLGESVALEDSNGNDLAVSRYAPPPDTKSVAAHHLGRMFAAVIEPYEVGCVVVSNGSTSVTGVGTEWKTTFAGRFLDVSGASKPFEIASVSGSGTLTLTEPYSGPSSSFANYAIRPGLSERREIRWSEAALPEAWPTANSRELTEDPGAGELTGLMPLKSFLFILATNRVYKLSYQSNPATDGMVTVASMNGCVNNRCWVIVDGIAYMLCNTGIHAFMGNDDEFVSDSIQDMFENNPSGKYRINWKASRYFHAVHNPGERVIRWYVALSGSYTPHHALCLNYEKKKCWIEYHPYPVGCSALGYPGGRPQVYFGSHGKRFLASAVGTIDGPDPHAGTVRGTVTSAGPTWFADSTAVFPSTGVSGFPVAIVSGKGKGQVRIVSSVSGTRINVVQPWSIKPDTTSMYQLGGFIWTWKSGWFKWAESGAETERSLSVQFKPNADACAMNMRIYRDLSTTPQLWSVDRLQEHNNGVGMTKDSADMSIDVEKTNGFVQARFNDYTGWYTDGRRFVSVELNGVPHITQHRIYRVRLDGVD